MLRTAILKGVLSCMKNEQNNNSSGSYKPTITSGKLTPVWVESVPPLRFSSLTGNIFVDVVIVGAGIAGLSVAYQLSKEGKKVAIIEDGLVGSGETGRTTAHLVNALDDRYFEIERLHGEKGAFLAAQSHTKAIDEIEKIVKEEKINCNFERVEGYLFLHPSDELENLHRELESLRRAGVDVEMLDNTPLGYDTGPALFFPNQAQFHPLKYLEGLTKAIIRNNGLIFTETHAQKIDSSGVETSAGHKINASHIVVATNSPVNNMIIPHTKQASYRTYVVACIVPKNSVKKALYWDTGDHTERRHSPPYHYIRLESLSDTQDILIIGGEDHKTGQIDPMQDKFAKLRSWAKEHFPVIKNFDYEWSGQVIETIDCIAFIGKNSSDDNIYIVTGDSGNGMTHGTIAGILITDLIFGRENDWAKIYDPARKSAGALKEFLEENINTAKQYADWVKKGTIDSVEELQANHGAILNQGLKKLAVYKDSKNNIHAFSAVCPHLGGIVRWNETEKTFDCPCHGSRFSNMGKVVNGPSNDDLKVEKLEENKSEMRR